MISFSQNMRFVPGMIHGLQQSGLQGRLQVEARSNLQKDKLDRIVTQFFTVREFTEEPDSDNSIWLARRFLNWIIGLQQHAHVMVSSKYYLGAPHNQKNDSTEFAFVLPFSIQSEAINSCFQWLAELIKCIQESSPDEDPSPDRLRGAREGFDKLTQTLGPFIAPSINRYYIAAAAFDMGLPIRPLRSDTFCIGTGSKTRLVSSSYTDETSVIGARLSKNKMFTAELLRSAGLPAPTQTLVKSEQQVAEAAWKIGMPVVVKPADLDEGRGVAADLRDENTVLEAYRVAARASRHILVEKHFEGFTHRLTVFQGEVIKTVKRIAGGVTGDGVHTMERLVELAQENERLQRISRRHGRQVLSIDEEALALMKLENLTPQSIPGEGCYVRMRRKDNASAGGRNEMLSLDSVHPDNLLLAIRAANLLRLDFAGIDLIISDISKSWLDVGALICEVNAQPTLGISDTPDIYQKILSRLLPGGGRIPAHLIIAFPSCQPPQDDLIRLQSTLACRGLSNKSGLWMDEKQMAASFTNNFVAARALLNCVDVDSALCLMEPDEICQYGLPVDWYDSLHILGSEQATAQENQRLSEALRLIEDHVGSIAYDSL
ncbi:MAG: hypothetical protein O2971_08715 [Proteobacteria bacterium]|nr:hypothetical protein [Pseudomonadota bacterium]